MSGGCLVGAARKLHVRATPQEAASSLPMNAAPLIWQVVETPATGSLDGSFETPSRGHKKPNMSESPNSEHSASSAGSSFCVLL